MRNFKDFDMEMVMVTDLKKLSLNDFESGNFSSYK